ncbi:MAG: FHA domain-containing protein [Candidatus Micrarchaeota archaeon]
MRIGLCASRRLARWTRLSNGKLPDATAMFGKAIEPEPPKAGPPPLPTKAAPAVPAEPEQKKERPKRDSTVPVDDEPNLIVGEIRIIDGIGGADESPAQNAGTSSTVPMAMELHRVVGAAVAGVLGDGIAAQPGEAEDAQVTTSRIVQVSAPEQVAAAPPAEDAAPRAGLPLRDPMSDTGRITPPPSVVIPALASAIARATGGVAEQDFFLESGIKVKRKTKTEYGIQIRTTVLHSDTEMLHVEDGNTITLGRDGKCDVILYTEDAPELTELKYESGRVFVREKGQEGFTELPVETGKKYFHQMGATVIELLMSPEWASSYLWVKPFERLGEDTYFENPRIIIGKSGLCDLRLNDRSLADEQAEIVFHGDIAYVRAMEAKNEIMLNGHKVPHERHVMLFENDVLQVGTARLDILRLNPPALIIPTMKGRLVHISVSDEEGNRVTEDPIELDFNKNDRLLIGRKPEEWEHSGGSFRKKVLRLPGQHISRQHAAIGFGEDGILAIMDNSSYLGISINGFEDRGRSELSSDIHHLVNGDTVSIGGYSLFVSSVYNGGAVHEVSIDLSAGPLFSEIKSSGLIPAGGERGCRERLNYMEQALKTLPTDISGSAVDVWSRWTGHEISSLKDGLPEAEWEAGYEKVMNAMEYLVSKICRSSNPRAMIEFFDKNPRIIEYAMLSRKFRVRDRLKVVKVKADRRLMGKVKKIIKGSNDPGECLSAIADAIPENMRNGTDLEDLNSRFHSRRLSGHRFLAQLNRLLNPHGVAFWKLETDNWFAPAQVVEIVQSAEADSVVVKDVRGFESIFRSRQGQMWGGFCDTRVGMIFLAFETDRKLGHAHEVHHLRDGISGYIDYITGKFSKDTASAGMHIEATAFAAELAYSDIPDENILRELRAGSHGFGKHARARKLLLNHIISTHSGMPKEILMHFIDGQYLEALGLTHTELFVNNNVPTPAMIVHSAIEKKFGDARPIDVDISDI